MSVEDKLQELLDIKQAIRTALEAKGIPMTNVAFTEYANKILEISGGGVVDEYYNYAKDYYTATNNATLFENAWQDMKDSETVLFDIPLALDAPGFDLDGMIVDLYVGTNGQLQALYDACVNETILPDDVYYVNNVATLFLGGEFPLYIFGNLSSDDGLFIIGDLTPFEMGLGLVLMRAVDVPIPDNKIVIQQGFEFENENGIIIPNSVTSIGESAFYSWESNNLPLVISDSVTSIGEHAFHYWKANNQPLVIPNSVTSISDSAFNGWTSNNNPLVIPSSVTSIGYEAFANWVVVPYVEIQAITPPTLASSSAFDAQGNAPIYVPDESVEAYKTATEWVSLAYRIFPISDKDEYFYYAKDYYTTTNNATIFENAWQDSQDSETVLFDIPLTLVAPNQEIGGFTVDLYVGTNGQLQALYDACANETIPTPPPPIYDPDVERLTLDVYYVNNVATTYMGDIGGDVGFPIPIYCFGSLFGADSNLFLIADLTPLEMGIGLALIKFVDVSIPNNNIVIQQGFKYENENGIIISDSVTTIGAWAFYNWSSNNKPLIIPQGVTSIGDYAFWLWESHNHPLVIPSSVTVISDRAFSNWRENNQPLTIQQGVTSIGDYAFYGWNSNDHSLTIPNSVTSIGDYAFNNWTSNNQPLTISNSVTSIGRNTFYYWQSNNHPLTIPSSVTSIGDYAFYEWRVNNQPLVISNSVTNIGIYAFSNWEANSHQLVIPNGVTSIGAYAFGDWKVNDKPLIIPSSVTSIGDRAFYWWLNVAYVEMQSLTPPSLAHSNAFSSQGNAPIYVPDESVDDYKTATEWVSLADRIFPISDKV